MHHEYSRRTLTILRVMPTRCVLVVLLCTWYVITCILHGGGVTMQTIEPLFCNLHVIRISHVIIWKGVLPRECITCKVCRCSTVEKSNRPCTQEECAYVTFTRVLLQYLSVTNTVHVVIVYGCFTTSNIYLFTGKVQ